MVKVLYYKGEGIDKGAEIVKEFEKINNVLFKFEICLDFDIEELGLFNFNNNYILINPTLAPKMDLFDYGYPLCQDMTTVILHEFGHYLDSIFDIENSYKDFCIDNGRCYITPYVSETDLLCEEIAELILLYISNPYLLKTIDKDRFNFFKKYFKTPTPVTEKSFIKIWNGWGKNTQNECFHRYGLKCTKNKIIYKKRDALYKGLTFTKVESELKKRIK